MQKVSVGQWADGGTMLTCYGHRCPVCEIAWAYGELSATLRVGQVENNNRLTCPRCHPEQEHWKYVDDDDFDAYVLNVRAGIMTRHV